MGSERGREISNLEKEHTPCGAMANRMLMMMGLATDNNQECILSCLFMLAKLDHSECSSETLLLNPLQ